MGRFVQIKDWTPGYLNVCPAHVEIHVICGGCGEEREFDRRSVPVSLRHELIEDIEPRLKCSLCGAKAAKLIFGYIAAEERF
jgi:hypothetical protein